MQTKILMRVVIDLEVFMSLRSIAQAIEEIVVNESNESNDVPEGSDRVVFYPEMPPPSVVMEMHDGEKIVAEPRVENIGNENVDLDSFVELGPNDEINIDLGELGEIGAKDNVNIDIIISDIPGVDKLDVEKEKQLEISEAPEDDGDDKEDKEEESEEKKSRWSWDSVGLENFIDWAKEIYDNVPRHSGYEETGIGRAISYLQRLDSEISKAMRVDFDGVIDANEIEKLRSKIEGGLDKLNERFEKLNKKSKKTNKKSFINIANFVKNGQKVTGVDGHIVITVPLLISRIARVCINGAVSAGHDIEDLFHKQVKKYKLNEREKAEVIQLMSDMGYPIFQDRGFLIDEDVDVTSSDNFDWAAQYDR